MPPQTPKKKRKSTRQPKSRKIRSARHGALPPKQAGSPSELITMQEAIAILKTTRPTFYRWLRTGKIKGMKIGRQWRFYRDDIERFLKGQAPRVDLPVDIGPLIQTLRTQARRLGGKSLPGRDSSDVRDAVRLMILLGALMRASDIHITSHLLSDGAEPVTVLRYRLDGVLHQAVTIDVRLLPAIIEEWKRMAACDVHETNRPQDGRIVVRLAELDESLPDRTIDLRVCFLPAGLGESLTVRILDAAAVSLDLDRIDYAPHDRARLERALQAPWGLLLVTGPTGCGKTTTLYSCLNKLARPEIKIMTVEDPIEYFLPWATQAAVKESAGVTFPRAMRAILRSDPDVILIGELRNFETLSIAQQAALTGHLVLTTLHAEEAASALKRMVEMGSDPFVVADSTRLTMSQRLVRKLCPHCSVDGTPPAHLLDAAVEAARKGGLNWDALADNFRKPVGCEKCAMTGYKGRTVIAETLEVTPQIGRALRNDASVEQLRAIAVSEGMTTMAADGIRRAANGETTLDEILRVIG